MLTKRLGHVPALDGLRGIAIVMVMLAHGFHLQGGVLGVDLFFVLSGFLITTLLLEEYAANESVSLRNFVRRRAVRLLPALIMMLAVLSVAAVAIRGTSALHRIGVYNLEAVGYITNVMLVTDPGAVSIYLKHLWSLAQEEQFYLLWPPLLLLILRWAPRRLPVALAVATAASVTDLYLPWWSPAHRYSGPDTHASPILIGCLAAALRANGFIVGKRLGMFGILGAPLVAVMVTVVAVPGLDYPLFACFCAAGVLYVVERPSSRAARVLAAPQLVWLGTISYSLYLWHFPLLAPGPLPWLTYPAAIAIAAASTRYLEQPLIRRFRSPQRPTRTGRAPSAANLETV